MTIVVEEDEDPVRKCTVEELIPKEKDFLDNVRILLADQLEKVSLFAEWGRRDLAEAMGEEIKEQLLTQRRVKAHIKALETIREKPHQRGKLPNFEVRLEEKTLQNLSARYDPEDDENYKSYKVVLAQMDTVSGLVDEDIEMAGTSEAIAPNSHCPLCQKSLAELEDPVEDQVGYVYERTAIERYLTAEGSGRNKEAQCPVAGTSHTVSKTRLMPAVRVKFALRKKRHRPDDIQSPEPIL